MSGLRGVGGVEQIAGAADGFLGQEVVPSGSISTQEQYGRIPQPKFDAEGNVIVEGALREAKNIQSSLDRAVTIHVEKKGMVGPDLPALVEATKRVTDLEGLNTSEIRLRAAETNLSLADDNVARHKREHNGQNGDLTEILDATVKARQAREAKNK